MNIRAFFIGSASFSVPWCKENGFMGTVTVLTVHTAVATFQYFKYVYIRGKCSGN